MGKNCYRGNRRAGNAGNEEAEPWASSSTPQLKRQSNHSRRELFPLLPSPLPPQAVIKHKPRDDKSFNQDNPYQRNPQRQIQPQQQVQIVPPRLNQGNNIQPSSSISPQQTPHHAFLKKSQRLKHNLIWTLNETLNQIDQWFPDETLDKDAMDWQPEDEIVIPQRDDTVYTYGEVRRLGSCMDAEVEVVCEMSKLPRQRAVSDVGVGYSRSAGRFPVLV